MLNERIPVLMFHSLRHPADDDFYLAYPAAHFERACVQLLARGFRFVTVEEIVRGRCASFEKAVCFSFDDGFADNYHLLLPIVKRLGVPVTVFLSADHVGTEASPPQTESGSRWLRPFLSASQITEMHKSGLVDFQGHSMTHTWLPISGKVLATHPIQKLDEFYWIYWNHFPKQKPGATRSQMLALPHGRFAVFEHSRALNCRRFFPDTDEFHAGTRQPGEEVSGWFETQAEQRCRYEEELITSKRQIEALLGKELCFLCWPGGEMDSLSYEVFRQAGYAACSVPTSQTKRQNADRLFASDQKVIRRVGAPSEWRGWDLGPAGVVDGVRQWHKFSRWLRLRQKARRGIWWLRAKVSPKESR